MELKVGDLVVYAAHGVGRIAARERRLVGTAKQDVVVVELSEGLTVSLTLDRAQVQLRELASEAQLRLVQKTLRQKPVTSEKPWLARQRDTLAKLTSGDALGMAEIVRDSAPREWALTAKGTKTQAPTGERDVFLKARHLLSIEIAHARGLEPVEAEQWIEHQLARA